MPAGVVGGGHPLHLHGVRLVQLLIQILLMLLQHTFHVVRSAGSDVYNYNDPVMRDVVNIGTLTTENVTIRFQVSVYCLFLIVGLFIDTAFLDR